MYSYVSTQCQPYNQYWLIHNNMLLNTTSLIKIAYIHCGSLEYIHNCILRRNVWAWMCVWLRVCVSVCVCHGCVCVHEWLHVCVYTIVRVQVCIWDFVRVFVHMYVHMCVCVCVCVCVRACTRVRAMSMRVSYASFQLYTKFIIIVVQLLLLIITDQWWKRCARMQVNYRVWSQSFARDIDVCCCRRWSVSLDGHGCCCCCCCCGGGGGCCWFSLSDDEWFSLSGELSRCSLLSILCTFLTICSCSCRRATNCCLRLIACTCTCK